MLTSRFSIRSHEAAAEGIVVFYFLKHLLSLEAEAMLMFLVLVLGCILQWEEVGNSYLEVFHGITEGLTLLDGSVNQHAPSK